MIFSADSLRRFIEIRRSGLPGNFAEWTYFVKKNEKKTINSKYITKVYS